MEGGAVASPQDGGDQAGDGIGVAGVGQCVADVVQQEAYDRGWLFWQAGGRIEQDVGQAGPAGPPGGQAQQLGPQLAGGLVLPPCPRCGFRQGPGQRGDQHRVTGAQADIGDADLQGRILLGQPGVEVDHPGIQDRAGAHHLPHRVVVGLGAAEHPGWSRAGPAAPGLVAEARVGAVASLPERGVSAQRQQDRQPWPDAVQDGNAFLRRGDLHMHVTAAGELLVGGQSRTRRPSSGSGCYLLARALPRPVRSPARPPAPRRGPPQRRPAPGTAGSPGRVHPGYGRAGYWFPAAAAAFRNPAPAPHPGPRHRERRPGRTPPAWQRAEWSRPWPAACPCPARPAAALLPRLRCADPPLQHLTLSA